MARVNTLKDRVRAIIRKYKRVNNHRYLYNNKADLQGTYNRIKLWWLIQEEKRGYSIFPMEFKRLVAFTVPEWTKLIKQPYGGYKSSIYSIFTQAVLPAINNKGGSSWRFVALLAWTSADGLRPSKDSAKRSTGNKATKKRDANARHTHRRRQRNKTR